MFGDERYKGYQGQKRRSECEELHHDKLEVENVCNDGLTENVILRKMRY